jgi:hypothetical protein
VWSLQKDILGFTFTGNSGKKTIILEELKQDFFLLQLHKWLGAVPCTGAQISFLEFKSMIMKLRHLFISIPSGIVLINPCNALLAKTDNGIPVMEPSIVPSPQRLLYNTERCNHLVNTMQ